MTETDKPDQERPTPKPPVPAPLRPPERPALQAKPRLNRIEVGDPRPRQERLKKELDMVSSHLELPPMRRDEAPVPVAPSAPAGARVVGIEPQAVAYLLTVIVKEGEFNPLAFGSVTLCIGDAGATRFFLRYTGSGRAPAGHLALTLRAATPEEVRAATDAYLAAARARLYEGTVEG